MPHKTIIRLSGVARNPANGFPARLPVLAFRMSRWWGTLILGFLSIAVVGICLVGYLGFGIAYVPSALAMLVATVLSVRRPRTD